MNTTESPQTTHPPTPCCCPPKPTWQTGSLQTPAGSIITISTTLSSQDRINAIKCRIGNFRSSYTVSPNLYAVGSPDQSSPVLVTANYKLTFDSLRKHLQGIDAWILILDTKGINVWCAAGKGTFGTTELIRRIALTKLGEVVDHKTLIVPQLGAVGVAAHLVKKETGFRVAFGPILAHDIPAYLNNNQRVTPPMRRIRFTLRDRAKLVPMELIPALRKVWPAAVLLLCLGGLTPIGIMFYFVQIRGLPLLGILLSAVASGTILTPLFLPWIPFRSFALKGFLTGVVATSLFFLDGSLDLHEVSSILQAIFFLTLFPAISSYFALLFTGSTPYTSPSGVQKEMHFAVPLYISAGAIAAISYTLFILREWGFWR